MPSLGLVGVLSRAGEHARHGHAGYGHHAGGYSGYVHQGHNKADYNHYYTPAYYG